MFRFVWHKIKNKKWLNLCLLVGVSLLIALFACHPMFEKGANNQVLETEFLSYAEEKNEFPATMGRVGSYDISEYPTVQSLHQRLQQYIEKWTSYVRLDVVEKQEYFSLSGGNADSSLGGKNYYLGIGFLTDMEEHIQMVRGKSLSEAETESGIFPCIISEKVMDAYGLVVGERLSFPYVLGSSGEPLQLEIAGVCKESSNQDAYWYHELSYYEKQVFVSEETFDILMEKYGHEKVSYEENLLLDYTGMNSDNASLYADYIRQFHEADAAFTENFLETLENFETEKRTIQMMLWALELPCVVLLLLFIYMVSSQILTSEEGEIAVLRSRGATRLQTVRLYFYQSGIISGIGLGTGLFLGYGMCKCAASTDAFLRFVKKEVSLYRFHWEMLLYGLAAGVIAMLFMTIPVWKRSKVTIVEQKGKNIYVKHIPFWERSFLDILLVALSGYFLYNFNKQKDTLALSIIAQESIDPIILLNSSLFIFAVGLLFLRLCRYLVLLVSRVGKKYWGPSMFASFLQLQRTFYRQGFLIIFLIMTIAGGIFDANMARTMNNNMEERIAYNSGADVQFMENWKLQIAKSKTDEKYRWEYTEPDYGSYSTLIEEGLCESMTRVIEDDNVELSAEGKIITGANLMAIHTREFGETAELMDGLNDTHWFHALNALAADPDGVILSQNAADALGVKVGDTISYSRYHPIKSRENEKMGTESATVCAIVDSFPGYERYRYEEKGEENEKEKIEEQENYLIVANYATVVSEFQLTPYHIWMRLSKNATSEEIMEYLRKQEIEPLEWQSAQEQITQNRNSAMVQVTNGMFTLSFVISLVICSVGFLIYWIMSIKNRELLFGIYRAMGMSMREIYGMLINEQIFSSILAILAGGGIGALSTWLFVRLMALVYLPKKHNIPIHIYIYASDLVKLAVVVLAVVFLCYVILCVLLRKMKIAQALRLGED